jgi:hypothetical protein
MFLVRYYALKPGTRLYRSTCDKICISWLIINLHLDDDIDGLSVYVTPRVASGWWQWRWGHGADGWRFIESEIIFPIIVLRVTIETCVPTHKPEHCNSAAVLWGNITRGRPNYFVLFPGLGKWKIRVTGYDLLLCLTSQITILCVLRLK